MGTNKQDPEFIGQLVDIFEDYLTEKSDDIDEVHIKGKDYDRIAERLEERISAWTSIVYLVVANDYRNAPEYYICRDTEAAHKLFEKIVRENYYDGTPEEELKLREQLESSDGGEWQYDDITVSYYFYNVLTSDDIRKGDGCI